MIERTSLNKKVLGRAAGNGLERLELQKPRVLVASLKYTIADDHSWEVLKTLIDSGRFEAKLIKCLGPEHLDILVGEIALGNYSAIVIVWEWAFVEEDVQTFVRAVRSKFPELKMIAASNHPGCREMLMEAGCSDEFETATLPVLFAQTLLNTLETA